MSDQLDAHAGADAGGEQAALGWWVPFLLGYGAYAVVAQATFVRETLVVFFGNEVSLGITLGSWLFGVFVGASLIGRLPGVGRRLALALALLGLVVFHPLGVFFLRRLRLIVGAPAGGYLSFAQIAVGSLLLVGPAGCMVGVLFPLISRQVSEGRQGAGGIGLVYVMEAAGSVLGGVAFSFWLVTHLDAFSASFVAAACLLVAYGLARRSTESLALAALGAALLAASLVGAGRRLDLYSQLERWQGFGTGLTIALDEAGRPLMADSKYQNIVIATADGQTSAYANGLVHTTFPDPYGARQEAAVVMAQHPAPRRMLLLGSGYAALAGELLRYPLERLDLVELDGRMLSMLHRRLPPDAVRRIEDPRFRAYACDGRFFVLSAAQDPGRLGHPRSGGGELPCGRADGLYRYHAPDPGPGLRTRGRDPWHERLHVRLGPARCGHLGGGGAGRAVPSHRCPPGLLRAPFPDLLPRGEDRPRQPGPRQLRAGAVEPGRPARGPLA
ncbi:MAG: spermine/spermidine synthase domain-containing protein [Planctomycetota bacterium]|jgi:spermidine synthase